MNGLIALLSLLYQTGCRIKNVFYDRQLAKAKKAPLPVISIGNLSFGGSEKTPLAMWLIEELSRQGYKPALITRGYKGRWESEGGVLSAGKEPLGTWRDGGDEAFMVSSNFPEAGVFIGKKRIESCRNARNQGFDIAVCDDGFQHRRLFRDIDIVLYDPSRNEPLRESVSSLKRAHILLMKKNIDAGTRKAVAARFPRLKAFAYSVFTVGFFSLDDKAQSGAYSLRRKRILAFSGIAHPGRFLGQLKSEDIHPESFLQFADHHTYPPASIAKIRAELEKKKSEAMITTEKDAVKIKDASLFREVPTFYLKIGIKTEKGVSDRIKELLKTTQPRNQRKKPS